MKVEGRRALETLEYISKIIDQANITDNRYMVSPSKVGCHFMDVDLTYGIRGVWNLSMPVDH